METKELKVQIPEGYEIDWQESAKQEKIVFKKKDTNPRSWKEFQEVTPLFFMGSPSTCKKSHDHGWKEGVEFTLTEFVINKKKELLKQYMNIHS